MPQVLDAQVKEPVKPAKAPPFRDAREGEVVRLFNMQWSVPKPGTKVRTPTYNHLNRCSGEYCVEILGELKRPIWHTVVGDAETTLHSETVA